MPGAMVRAPQIPDKWAAKPTTMGPNYRKAHESTWDAVTRALVRLAGLDTPQGVADNAVFGMAAPLEVPVNAARSALEKVARTIKAYHGSPHDFDQFSLSKIGTGEGAQAYGHGLYFAENEGVANTYRASDAGRAFQSRFSRKPSYRVGNQVLTPSNPDELEVLFTVANAQAHKTDAADVLGANLRDEVERLRTSQYLNHPTLGVTWRKSLAEAERKLALFDSVKDKGVVPDINTGRMYEVEINADPDTLLDWDKPIAEQSPRLQRFARDVFQASGALHPSRVMETSGESVYRSAPILARKSGLATAEQLMRQQGIPGIKYLDGGSRAGGEGTRNYVIFDDSLVTILKKYGVALGVIEGLRRQAAANGGRLPAADVEGAIQQ